MRQGWPGRSSPTIVTLCKTVLRTRARVSTAIGPGKWIAKDWPSFPIAERWAYLDHAAVAPLPAGAFGRCVAGLGRRSVAELRVVRLGPDWERKVEETASRRRVGHALERPARGSRVRLGSTTHGISLVAEGFPWREGDSVVTAAEEYPSNVYPWMNLASRDVSLRTVESRDGRIWIRDLAVAIDETTRVVTISHVEFSSGFRNDIDSLAEICHARGVALFVDAIQGLGPLVIDVDRTPIDFLAADGHKWLLGPEGAGLLYVRKDWIERLRPLGVGWHSVVSSYNAPSNDFTLKPSRPALGRGLVQYARDSRRSVRASRCCSKSVGNRSRSASLIGPRRCARSRLSVGWTIFGSTRPGDLSGIVALERPGVDPNAARPQTARRGIVVAARRGRLRVSPHVYNNDDDLDLLTQGLASG